MGVLQRPQDFDALDGVNTQVGFHIHVEFEHIGGIAGFFTDDGEEGGDKRTRLRVLSCGL